jgi:hypothetical protein
MILLKEILSRDEFIDLKIKTFWLDHIKNKIPNYSGELKILLNEIDLILENDFLKSPEHFPSGNNSDASPNKVGEKLEIKDKVLTVDSNESVDKFIETSTSNTFLRSTYKPSHRISLTPKSKPIGNPNLFNKDKSSGGNLNLGSKKEEPKKVSRVSKKMLGQLTPITNESSGFRLLTPSQKSTALTGPIRLENNTPSKFNLEPVSKRDSVKFTI